MGIGNSTTWRFNRMQPMRWIVLSSLALTLTGCGSASMNDLREYAVDVKSRQKGQIEPLPEIKTFETFVYQSEGLRDPFTPTSQAQETTVSARDNGLRPDSDRRREELEAFSLDGLRMVGTLDQAALAWGLLVTNEGIVHRVQVGNYAGQNHGKITRITEEKIELTEIIPDGLGGWRERQASLALSE